MGELGLAHGDLQHGNILVENGELRLIDYDAMFIPGMSGRSHEVGHRNFQHPKRSESDFDGRLDHFSAWVIALSLRALVIEPKLWSEVQGGDEGLLFRKEDFLKPDSSKVFAALSKLGDKELDLDVAYFKAALAGPANAVVSPLNRPAPAASQAAKVVSAPAVSQPSSTAPSQSQSQSQSSGSATIVHRSAPSPAQAAVSSAPRSAAPVTPASAAPAAARSAPAATSALSATTAGGSERLQASVIPERSVLALAVISWAGLGIAAWQALLPLEQAGAGAGAAAILLILFLVGRFASLPQVQRLRDHQDERDRVKTETQQSSARIAALVEVEGRFKSARRLDFDELSETLASREGRAMLWQIMEHLEQQPLTDDAAPGLDVTVGRLLAKRGLKNALRLRDILSSRSLATGETAEELIVVLQNGRQLESPRLTRPQAEALLSWRQTLEKQFVSAAMAQERLRADELTRRAQDLDVAIARHAQINGLRFLSLIFGVS